MSAVDFTSITNVMRAMEDTLTEVTKEQLLMRKKQIEEEVKRLALEMKEINKSMTLIILKGFLEEREVRKREERKK